jgi:hypothetical protein
MCASALSSNSKESNIVNVGSQRDSVRVCGICEIDLLLCWLLSTDGRENWHF